MTLCQEEPGQASLIAVDAEPQRFAGDTLDQHRDVPVTTPQRRFVE